MSVTRFDFERAQIGTVRFNEGTLVSAKYVLNGAHVLRSGALLLDANLLDGITRLVHRRAKASLLLVLSSLPREASDL